ncbi:MAG: hypothetical protein JXR26_11705 [Balneolaceae bacterium]|nr:hypothetical protein [Balneolaceae bacterium]
MNKKMVTDFMVKSMVLLFTALMLILTACEGPAGSQGPRGPEGAVGPIGPAGEDGSMMYAGAGEPAADIGTVGDYYLNSTTGEFYGPKSDDGWGDPIIVLMGDDGADGTKIHSGSGAPKASLGVNGDFYIDLTNQDLYGPKTDDGWGDPVNLNGEDGQDGADGQDGEDGSQIYAGDGPPDASQGKVGDYYLDQTNKDLYGPKTESGWGQPINLSGEDGQDGADGQDGEDGSRIYAGSGAPDASLGKVGDYYLDKSSFELYGPKTASNGWGMPINIKGADGNANVTRYIFPGHDFSSSVNKTVAFPQITDEKVMKESSFLVYLVIISPNYERYHHIPGYAAANDVFSVYRNVGLFNHMTINLYLKEGPGRMYDRIEVVHIKANDTVDETGVNGSLIPSYIDPSDYNAVARHYGFGSKTLKHQ